MKRWSFVFVSMGLAAALWAPVAAQAQGYGLQVVESCEQRDEAYFDLTAGVQVGRHSSFYGLRDTFAATDWMRFFVDIGAVDPERGSHVDLAGQGGMTVNLPLDVPFDVGLRPAIYGMNGDQMNVFGANLMGLASKEAIFVGLFFYGGLGIDYRHIEYSAMEQGHEDSEEKVNPILAMGALMPLMERLWFYSELTVTDETYIGCGLRFR